MQVTVFRTVLLRRSQTPSDMGIRWLQGSGRLRGLQEKHPWAIFSADSCGWCSAASQIPEELSFRVKPSRELWWSSPGQKLPETRQALGSQRHGVTH